MSSIERITIKLPAGFDPAKHEKALAALIAKSYGSGFEIDSIDPAAQTASASRQVAITEVRQDTKTDSFEVRLARGTKPADGDRVATKLADQYAGHEMTRFEPFLGKATLTRLTDAEARCRGAVSVALGVKPWEVQVKASPDGGFDLELPRTYVGSKHESKLDEVATTVVGREGWYVAINAQQLTAKIVPSDPPTFPGAITYPMKSLKGAPRDKVALGEKLSKPGQETNDLLWLDFEAAPHTQISGTSGSGKLQSLSDLVPVPVSERFPNGWATVGDLRAGDWLYGADGAAIELLGLSDTLRVDLYDVHLSDGQVIRTGGEHLWRASSGAQRCNQGQTDPATRAGRFARAEELRALAAAVVKPGTYAAAVHIAQIVGYDDVYVRSVLRRHDIGYEDVYERQTYGVRRKTMDVAHFAADAAFAALNAAGRGTAMDPAAFVGEWRTARDIAFITGIGNSREAATKVRRLLRGRGVPEKDIEITVESHPHERRIKVRTYPLAEVLTLLAEEHVRAYEPGDIHDAKPHFSVLSTETMAEQMHYGADEALNWSIEVPAAIDGPDVDLPVDPYVLGAWLGNGATKSGGFTGIDPEITDEIEASGYPVTHYSCRKAHNIVGLAADLRAAGVLGGKHIPAAYLRASAVQRLAVLQGLMDTDGTVDANGSCELSLSDRRLATGALELVRSLGIKASISWSQPASYRDADGNLVECKDQHRIHFTTTARVFRLPRKIERLPRTVRATQNRVYVTAIEPAGKGLARCLRVSAPDGMYLTGGFIQTHNSVTLNALITGALAGGCELSILDLPHKAVDFYWVKDFCRDGGWGCDSLRAAVASITLTYQEGERRARILAERGATKWTELPTSEQFKPILVLVDEVTGLIQLDDVPKGISKDHPLVVEAMEANLLRQTLLGYMKKIAAEMRFVGIRMVLSSQVSSVNTGIPTALRMNLANKFLLGSNPTDGNRKLSLSDPTSVPKVPDNVRRDDKAARGVGVAELEGKVPSVFKSFYASTDDLRAGLDNLGLPRTSRPAPTATEIARLTPSLDDDGDGGGGRRGGSRQQGGGERSPVSGRLASEIAREMGDDTSHMYDEDGKKRTGFDKANAARSAVVAGAKATPPARRPDQNNPFNQDGPDHDGTGDRW